MQFDLLMEKNGPFELLLQMKRYSDEGKVVSHPSKLSQKTENICWFSTVFQFIIQASITKLKFN